MIIPRTLLLALACASFTRAAFAADPAPAATPAAEAPAPAPEAPAALAVGSPAPALSPAKWLQGEPVKAFEKDKVYLVECWATWCGPCVAAIPHVNELHNKFKDKGLVVIGVNVWESPESKAAEFVKKKGAGMAYRVAYDGGDEGLVAKHWLRAAGANGIPHAFVVRESKILWHGHPSELSEEVVADMLAGKFDAAKVAAAAKAKEADGARLAELQQKIGELIEAKKFEEAEAALTEQSTLAAKLMPERAAFVKEGGLIEICLAKGDKKGAAAHIRAFADAAGKTEGMVGALWPAALQMTTDERLAGERDHAFALRCIVTLMEKEPQAAESPMVRLVHARLLDATGKSAEALKALEGVVAAKGRVPKEATDALAALKAGKAWPKDRLNPEGKAEVPAAAEAPATK